MGVLAISFPRLPVSSFFSSSHLLTFSSSLPHRQRYPKSRKKMLQVKKPQRYRNTSPHRHQQLTPNNSSTVTPPFHTACRSGHEQLDGNTTTPIPNPYPIQPQSNRIQNISNPNPIKLPAHPNPHPLNLVANENETKEVVQEAVSQASLASRRFLFPSANPRRSSVESIERSRFGARTGTSVTERPWRAASTELGLDQGIAAPFGGMLAIPAEIAL